MNKLHLIGLAAAALTCLPVAQAQDGGTAKLHAYVQLPNEKPADLELQGSDGNGMFYYLQRGSTDQQLGMPATDCKLFYIQTPADLVSAMAVYREGNLAEARKQLAAVKQKYEAYAGLPGSPYSTAAVAEITAAVRMQDWAAVKSLVGALKAADKLSVSDQARLRAASVIAETTDQPSSLEKQKAAIAELLKDKKVNKGIDTELYSWLRYALARAYAAQIPASQLEAIPEAKLEDANAAVDNYCQCVLATHGVANELPADAIVRAVTILWGTPGVQDYAKQVKPKSIDAKSWNNAPANFRDAVVMSKLLKDIYAPEGMQLPELVTKLEPYYFNSAKGTESAKAEAPADKPAEAPAK